MSIEENIRRYILENYLFTEDQSELDNQDSLLKKGIMDSTGIMELILYLEEEFKIKIDDDEIIPENMDSVNSILNFLNSKHVT